MLTLTTYRLSANEDELPCSKQFAPAYFKKLVRSLIFKIRDNYTERDYNLYAMFNFQTSPISHCQEMELPQIGCHYFNGTFYLTGINNGAKVVKLLAQSYKQAFTYEDVVYKGFRHHHGINNKTIKPGNKYYEYCVVNWIPPTSSFESLFASYSDSNERWLANKAVYQDHIFRDEFERNFYSFCRQYGIDSKGVNLQHPWGAGFINKTITHNGQKYHGYIYSFECNILIPNMLCVGLFAELGQGRIIERKEFWNVLNS
ncbi:hypothetical protein [uncultured Draconibacterium sp.]|uniref:hypothetical protein n=1 Tax=uncultured Draconibacterium sp. TaxID=1573823 RepID=UPI0029C9344E|nr:hypothetical protein [uncultured Draconibacterium sp.]